MSSATPSSAGPRPRPGPRSWSAAFNLLPVSPGSLIRGFYVLGVCLKERNFKDYKLALPVGFFKIIGYLAFPLQMAYRFPELARFMAAHWATEGVHVVPIFGERGAWLEHAVFDACYNYPLSLGIRIRKRDELAAAAKPRRWAIPAAALAGAAFTAVAELFFVRAAGHAAALKDVWWAVFPAAVVAGFLASMWSRRKRMGKRIVAGITAGALVGSAYGLDQHISSAVDARTSTRSGRGRRRLALAAHPLEDLHLRPARDPRRLHRRDPPAEGLTLVTYFFL